MNHIKFMCISALLLLSAPAWAESIELAPAHPTKPETPKPALEPDPLEIKDSYFSTLHSCIPASSTSIKEYSKYMNALVKYEFFMRAEGDELLKYENYDPTEAEFMAYEFCTYCVSIYYCLANSDRLKPKVKFTFKKSVGELSKFCSVVKSPSELMPKVAMGRACNKAIDELNAIGKANGKPIILRNSD